MPEEVPEPARGKESNTEDAICSSRNDDVTIEASERRCPASSSRGDDRDALERSIARVMRREGGCEEGGGGWGDTLGHKLYLSEAYLSHKRFRVSSGKSRLSCNF